MIEKGNHIKTIDYTLRFGTISLAIYGTFKTLVSRNELNMLRIFPMQTGRLLA